MNLSEDVEIKLINFIPGTGDEVKKTGGTTFISRNQLHQIFGLFQIIKDSKIKDLHLEIDHEGFNDHHKGAVEIQDIINRVINICENSVEELKNLIRKNYIDSNFLNKDKIKGIIKGKFGSNNKLEFESLIKFY